VGRIALYLVLSDFPQVDGDLQVALVNAVSELFQKHCLTEFELGLPDLARARRDVDEEIPEKQADRNL
jgi:hypothetical protein